MAVHVCNFSCSGSQGGRITWAHEFDTSLGNIVWPSLKQTNKKIIIIIIIFCGTGDWTQASQMLDKQPLSYIPSPHNFFFFAVLGFKLRAYTLRHCTSLRQGLKNYLPQLALNHHLPDLCNLWLQAWATGAQPKIIKKKKKLKENK
jgi:hypothetical protein